MKYDCQEGDRAIALMHGKLQNLQYCNVLSCSGTRICVRQLAGTKPNTANVSSADFFSEHSSVIFLASSGAGISAVTCRKHVAYLCSLCSTNSSRASEAASSTMPTWAAHATAQVTCRPGVVLLDRLLHAPLHSRCSPVSATRRFWKVCVSLKVALLR